GADAGLSFGVKNELRARHVPFDLVHFESHPCAIEAGARKRVAKFVLVLKEIKRRTWRKIDIQVGVCLDRVVHQFHKRIFRNLRPGGETKLTARLKNAGRFGAGALRISQMKKRKVRRDAIEAGIRKRKILGVAW